jgi:lipopolysaccharide biosynthesis protein
VLIAQNHSKEDSLEFIRYLIKYFKDERYILIDGKPLLIVYRANIIPDIYAIADSWRKEVRLHGFPDLYLVAAQTFDIADPAQFNFDAAMQFPPHAFSCGSINPEVKLLNPDFKGHFYSYEAAPGAYAIRTTEPDYKLFRSAMLSWDNTARKQNNSHIFYDFSLLRYKQWLSAIINKAYSNNKYSTDEKIIFVNAWNQWAEGTHLEPDQKFGYGYLQATYDALKNYDKTRLDKVHNVKLVQKNQQAIILHLHYVELWEEISDLLFSLNTIGFDLYISITSSDIAAKIRQDFPAAYIMLVDNRGRDILPFIKILSVVNQFDYTAVCKIHSKRSVHRVDGDSLRVEIFNELLRSKEAVNEIILRFKNNKKIGMIAGKKCLFRHNEENMASNSENVKNLAAKLNIDFTCDVFPAGSMFWFRPPALKLLCNLDENLFDIESGFADGTNAHAVERLFCTVVKSSGYTIEAC